MQGGSLLILGENWAVLGVSGVFWQVEKGRGIGLGGGPHHPMSTGDAGGIADTTGG